ncbi:MAG TPA: hypothetical protein VGT01_04390 [Candidatus Dormibacteraeota bacterium]|nr:hypothetical protein [Candidatus Dormibacteraeota bacterium]
MKVIAEIYSFHFKNERRERLFLASVGFLVTFGAVRLLTYTIRAGIGPFHNVTTSGGLHIHHLVWGILILLLVGYVWLIEEGVRSTWAASVTALAYGVGAALTLDEFALWLNLQDVYWERAGRISVDVVLVFASLLSVGIWGGPFLREVARELVRMFRRRAA